MRYKPVHLFPMSAFIRSCCMAVKVVCAALRVRRHVAAEVHKPHPFLPWSQWPRGAAPGGVGVTALDGDRNPAPLGRGRAPHLAVTLTQLTRCLSLPHAAVHADLSAMRTRGWCALRPSPESLRLLHTCRGFLTQDAALKGAWADARDPSRLYAVLQNGRQAFTIRDCALPPPLQRPARKARSQFLHDLS